MIERCKIKTRKKALALAISSALLSSITLAQETLEDETLDSEDGFFVEEVVVWGVRAAQARAIDIKRDNANIVDSIVAEDIGKMPDTTITDSLQRITGVQISREANEGTSLNVRGMPQVLTTLNGEQFLSPWTITSVGANYSDVPAGMIAGADVYKSQSASAISGGISGLVDLKTYAPSDLESGLTVKGKVELSQGSRSKNVTDTQGNQSTSDPDHNASLFFGYNMDDKFSVIVSGFDSSSYAANYAMYDDQRLAFLQGRNGSPHDPLDLNNNGDTANDWILVPSEFGARSSFMERDRTGATFSFEADIGENFSTRADIFYTKMEQYDRGVKAGFSGANRAEAYEVNGVLPMNRAGADTDPNQYREEEQYDVLTSGTLLGEGGQFTYTDIDGNSQTRNIATLLVANVASPSFQSVSTNDINRTAALNTNFELNYTNLDNFDASLRFIHAEAEKSFRKVSFEQGTPGWLWRDEDGVSGKDEIIPFEVSVDYRGEFPAFSFADDLTDTSLLSLYRGYGEGAETSAGLDALRTDMTYNFDEGGLFQSIDFGLRYGVRDAENMKFYYVTNTSRYSTYADARVPEEQQFKLREGNNVWQKYPEWLRFDYALEEASLRDPAIGNLQNNGFDSSDTVAFSDFGPIKGFESGVSAVHPSSWDNPLAFLDRLYSDVRTVADPGFTYSVEEASTSAYSQVNFGREYDGDRMGYSGNFGLRIVKTDRTVIKSVIPEVLDSTNSVGYEDWNKIAFVADKEEITHSYTDVLPSFNVSLFPTEDLVVRFGISQTMARNDLTNIGSGLTLWYQRCAKTDENGEPIQVLDSNGNSVTETVSCVGGGDDRGNPEMKPWRATVYNTSVEWYFDDNAILGAGLFLISVGDSVEEFQEQRFFLDGDGIDRQHPANVWTTANADASDLYGFELGYKHPFQFLPGLLSSTGMEFNYTYSNSESAEEDLAGDKFPLVSNSTHQTNLILWYDREPFSARLAYNWRSKEYRGRVGLNTNETPVSLGNWLEPTGYLDFSMNYAVADFMTINFFGTNITAQSRKTYSQYEDQFNSLWVQERRFSLGVTFTL